MSRRRRTLCMVVHGPFPYDTRVLREAHVAREIGFAVDVIATRQSGAPAQESYEGIDITRLPVRHVSGGSVGRVVYEYGLFTALATLTVARRMRTCRYAIVQVHNPPDFLVLAAVVPRLCGARVILDVHDLSTDMFEMRFGRRPGKRLAMWLLRVIETTAVRLADAVLTVHEPYRRELTRTGRALEQIEVVMNSIDERLLPAGPTPARPDGGFRVVYHGTVTPPYGVGLVVEALPRILAAVPEARLEIYGAGDAVPGVLERARTLGVAERVDATGAAVSHAEVLRAVSGASVGVVPNLPIPLNRFALSSKLFEYICLEIPVACARLPTLSEHFDENELWFFEPGNAESLADAVIAIANRPDDVAARVHAARRRYEDYSWPTNAARYAAVLERLCPAVRVEDPGV